MYEYSFVGKQWFISNNKANVANTGVLRIEKVKLQIFLPNIKPQDITRPVLIKKNPINMKKETKSKPPLN